MCGLIAAINGSRTGFNTDNWFRDALLASQVRGLDATGIFQKMAGGSVITYKQAVTASEFVKSTTARGMISAVPRSPFTVGHVRAATQGNAALDANAHPFRVQREDGSFVVGVHNGTLRGWKEKEGGLEQEVDSAWAFDIFAKEGPVDAFEYFNGAFAFIWYDSKYPDHIWMSRNDERPLHFFKSADDNTLLFSSELGMLGWLAQKHEFKRKAGPETKQFWWLDPANIYKFSLKNIGDYELVKRPKYDPATKKAIVTPSKAIVPVPTATNMSMYDYDDEYGEPWPSGSMYPYRQGWQNDQKYVLEGVKQALRMARYSKEDKTPDDENVIEGECEVVTQETLDNNLEQAIANEIERFRNTETLDVWQLIDNVFRIPDANCRNATLKEVKEAKDSGFYSRVIAFNGVMYDDEQGELLGDTYIKPVNGKAVTYDVIMRGLSKKAAHAQFIDKQVQMAVIIGVTDGIQPGEMSFIAAPISKHSREYLENRLGALKSLASC